MKLTAKNTKNPKMKTCFTMKINREFTPINANRGTGPSGWRPLASIGGCLRPLLCVLCGYSSFGQSITNQPVATSVMVNSNGVVIAPTNFAAANGFNTNGAGVSATLAPAKIYIGNALSNAAAQSVSGDLTLSTNGTAVLAATGTAGTYAQATFDSRGRETSGATVLPINAGGTGQTTASAGLAALGGIASSSGTGTSATLITPTIQPANGSTAPTVLFPSTSSQTGDQPFIISGSPFSSGAGLFLAMKCTNAIGVVDAFDPYFTVDALAMAWVMPGFQATNSNMPGTALGVANGPWPIVLAHAHAGVNVPNIYATGDVTNGDVVEIGYWNGGTNNNYPLPLRYDNTTNVFFKAATMPKLFEVNQNTAKVTVFNPASGGFVLANGTTLTDTNGIFIKANGFGNAAAMLDPTDNAPAGLNDASFTASNFLATAINKVTAVAAFDASGVISGMGYQVHGANTLVLLEHAHSVATLSGMNQGQIGNFNSVIIGGTDAETTNTTFGGNQNSVLQVMGSLGLKTVTQTANYTMTVDDEVCLMNGNTLTNVLPDATSACKGRIYTVKEISNSSCQVITSGTVGQKIDGATNYNLSAQFKYVTVQSDGTQWWIIANN